MTDTSFVIPGANWIHSFNMLKNLEYAYRVDDQNFIKQWFTVFFGTLDEKVRVDIDESFKKKTINIVAGENDGDAVISY